MVDLCKSTVLSTTLNLKQMCFIFIFGKSENHFGRLSTFDFLQELKEDGGRLCTIWIQRPAAMKPFLQHGCICTNWTLHKEVTMSGKVRSVPPCARAVGWPQLQPLLALVPLPEVGHGRAAVQILHYGSSAHSGPN